MSDQQYWFVLARSVIPHNQILLAIVGAGDVEITVGEAGIAKALRHGFSGGGHVAHRICGVDFDQLLENIMGELLGGVVNLSVGAGDEQCRAKQYA